MVPAQRLLTLALLLGAASAGASPVLSGIYQVGDLGLVEFSLQNGRVVGKYRGSGSCELGVGTEVVTGVFEGSVFVGTVVLCQDGAGCERQAGYPFLGIWHDDALSGRVKLHTGCTSSQLSGNVLHVAPASAEDKARLFGEASNTAEQLAAKNKTRKQLEDEARAAIEEGVQKTGTGDYRGARDALTRGLAYFPDNWNAHNALGVCQTHLGNPSDALTQLERALGLAQKEKAPAGKVAEIHYNTACALVALGKKKDALASLKAAVKAGGADDVLLDSLAHDPDLKALQDDAEFKVFYRDLRIAREKGKRQR